MADIGVDREPIYAFQPEDTYLFKHYFERTDIFSKLQEYYNGDEYRFEVPQDEFPAVSEYLEDNYYELIIVEDIDEFTVVKEEYTEHSAILRNSVMNWSRRGYNFFVMKDPLSVDQAVEQGATRIEDTDLVAGL